jgi:CRP-like cAMP-binding protein
VELAHRILVRSLREHSKLAPEDVEQITKLSFVLRQYDPDDDLIRQGDRPTSAILVLSGMVGRYHSLSNGRRQYLSFHMTGEMPDAQGLFIEHMDHAVCAIGRVVVAFIPHGDLVKAFKARPQLGFAVWRETLIDAAIFREAITNNSGRAVHMRMAHLFCELFYRARVSGVAEQKQLALPLNLIQLGETLGMSIATVNRTLQRLRTTGLVDFGAGVLTIKNWDGLVKIGGFDPRYLHLKRVSAL